MKANYRLGANNCNVAIQNRNTGSASFFFHQKIHTRMPSEMLKIEINLSLKWRYFPITRTQHKELLWLLLANKHFGKLLEPTHSCVLKYRSHLLALTTSVAEI